MKYSETMSSKSSSKKAGKAGYVRGGACVSGNMSKSSIRGSVVSATKKSGYVRGGALA